MSEYQIQSNAFHAELKQPDYYSSLCKHSDKLLYAWDDYRSALNLQSDPKLIETTRRVFQALMTMTLEDVMRENPPKNQTAKQP